MPEQVSKPFFKGTRGKVIAAFLLGFTGIALALSITYFSFGELMGTVDELSEPNRKLRSLNELFRKITSLDQQQRTELVKNYKYPSDKLLTGNKDLFLMLDTLKMMAWESNEQLERVFTMQEILRERDRLFVNYLHLRYEDARNKQFLLQLDSLSEVLSQHTVPFDTTIVTTQNQKTITSYVPVEETKDDRSFFKKLFNKKKKAEDEKQPVIKVQEEVSFITDTIPLTKKDSAVYHVSQSMKTLNSTERMRNREMIQRELQFIRVNTALLNELLMVLHEVETEEVKLMRANNEKAGDLVNSSIGTIIIFLIVFFLLAALLLFFILIDISKSSYYRNQLIKSKEEAEELGSIKQRFLSNMSHEIRTPLQSILGYSELLKKNGSGSDEALKAIQSSSEHLLHIVNEVLDFSRIESGKLTFQNQPFLLARCMEDVFAAIKIQAEQKNLTLNRQIHINDALMVSGDAFRLKQILYNVLSNAVKFTPTGFVTFEAGTLEFDHSVRCVIKVTDSGIGMDAKTRARIFNQFEQASAATGTLFGGTGLGLTIVKNLVDALHGTIEVTSKPGEGSVFTITLNFGKASSVNTRKPAEKLLNETSLPLKKVLIIDDDPLILRLCSIILTHQQIAHETIQEPEAALQYNKLNEISHVFLDIRMPKINGIEVCVQLREKLHRQLYIVALTAHALPNEQADLLHQGFDTVLLKPFRESDFLAVIGLTSAAQEAVSTKDIDFSVLEKMTFDDKALQSSVMHQFADETEEDIKFFKQALQSKDISTIREVIHKFTGRVGQMGGIALSARLKEAELELVSSEYNESLDTKVNVLLKDVQDFRELILERALQLQ